MRYSLIFSILLSDFSVRAQSAEKIHLSAILVDTHNDFLSKVVEDHVVFDTDLKGTTHSDLHACGRRSKSAGIFDFLDEHYGRGSAFKYANRELDSLYAIAGRNPQNHADCLFL